MQGCHVAGFVRQIHGFTLKPTTSPDGERELLFVYLFSFRSYPLIFMPRDQCGWQTQLHVCVEHVEGRRECVCSPMHDMQPGQMTPMAKWLFYTACTWKGGHFCLLFDTKGWRGRREDVCEIHHTAASLAQRSVTPTSSSRSPPAPSYLLSSELCMLACFVFSSFQWSTQVITMTGCVTLWQAVSVCRWPRWILVWLELATRLLPRLVDQIWNCRVSTTGVLDWIPKHVLLTLLRKWIDIFFFFWT